MVRLLLARAVAVRSRIGACTLALAVVAPFAAARADIVQETYDAAGVYGPSPATLCAGATTCVIGNNAFSTLTSGATTYSTGFTDAGGNLAAYNTANPGSPVTFTGTYAGGAHGSPSAASFFASAPDQYGGVPGSAYYPALAKNGNNAGYYTLTLTSTGVPGVNYFGIWISALDAYNVLTLYDGSTVIASVDQQQLINDLGGCGGSSPSAYCGNPVAGANHGGDSNELFAYVNFFDTTGYITAVTLQEAVGAGGQHFESDNHAVGFIDPIQPTGTPVFVSVPEPRGILLFGLAVLGIALVSRRAIA